MAFHGASWFRYQCINEKKKIENWLGARQVNKTPYEVAHGDAATTSDCPGCDFGGFGA